MSSSGATSRLVIDGTKCDGHGVCVLILAELISLDTWGYAALETEAIDDPRTLARARRAVHACPAGALSLVGPRDAGAPLLERRSRRVRQGRPR